MVGHSEFGAVSADEAFGRVNDGFGEYGGVVVGVVFKIARVQGFVLGIVWRIDDDFRVGFAFGVIALYRDATNRVGDFGDRVKIVRVHQMQYKVAFGLQPMMGVFEKAFAARGVVERKVKAGQVGAHPFVHRMHTIEIAFHQPNTIVVADHSGFGDIEHCPRLVQAVECGRREDVGEFFQMRTGPTSNVHHHRFASELAQLGAVNQVIHFKGRDFVPWVVNQDTVQVCIGFVVDGFGGVSEFAGVRLQLLVGHGQDGVWCIRVIAKHTCTDFPVSVTVTVPDSVTVSGRCTVILKRFGEDLAGGLLGEMKGVAEQPDNAQDEQENDETDFEHGGPFEGAFGWGHLDESGEGMWGRGW